MPVRDILAQIEKWWAAGETFGLATVVRTFHSAPSEMTNTMRPSAFLFVVTPVFDIPPLGS